MFAPWLNLPPAPVIANAVKTVVAVAAASSVLSIILLLRKPTTVSALSKRVVVGAGLGVIGFCAVVAGGVVTDVLAAALAWRAVTEMSKLVWLSGAKIFDWAVHGLSLLLLAVAAFTTLLSDSSLLCTAVVDAFALVSFLSVLGIPILLGRFRFMPETEAKAVMTLLLTGWSFAHFVLLRAVTNGFVACMFLIACIAASDIGAYFVGNLLGKNKMAPVISPGKTWEGFAGGTLCTLGVALICSLWFKLDAVPALALAMSVALLAPIGDLTISVMKRQAHVKDASNVLPGHGGILDRFGSFLIVTPVFHYLWLMTF